jgi:hypothetical protein
VSVTDGSPADKAAEQTADGRNQQWRRMVLREVADALSAGWEECAPEDGADLEDIERRVQRLLRVAGAVLVSRVAEAAARDLPRPVCPSCRGQHMEVACQRAREPEGLVGRYRLQRTVYVCRDCGQTAVPADEFWGLGPGKLSPALSRVVAAAAAEIPSFAQAAATTGETLGVELDASTVALSSEAAGAVAEQDRQAAVASLKQELHRAAPPAPPPPPPTAPPTVLISVDATKVHADKQWRDVKVGVVATLGPEVRRPTDGRASLVVGPHRYVAAIEPTDDFFYRLLSLLREADWSPGSPLTVLLIGDGAPFIWNYTARLEALGIRVHEVVDYYHASEHIWTVAGQVHRNDIEAQLWGETLSTALLTQGPAPVIAALEALSPRGAAAKDEVRKARDYFLTNAERMRYPVYAEHAWPLGSGIVESACRTVSGLRVKQPGMRWTFTGVQAMLTLRATRLSQHSQGADLWKSKPLRRRPPVTTLRRTEAQAA